MQKTMDTFVLDAYAGHLDNNDSLDIFLPHLMLQIMVYCGEAGVDPVPVVTRPFGNVNE